VPTTKTKLSHWDRIGPAGHINWRNSGALDGPPFVGTQKSAKGGLGCGAMGGLKGWIGVALLLCCCSVVNSLRMEILQHHTKCISDDIQEGVLTVGDYKVVEGSKLDHRVSCRVPASPFSLNSFCSSFLVLVLVLVLV
jgi:hypothetical protein